MNGEVEKRIKWINALRNYVTHNHSLPNLKGCDKSIKFSLIGTLIQILVTLTREGISRALDISDDRLLKQEMVNARNYLLTGASYGMRVEEETTKEYQERIMKKFEKEDIFSILKSIVQE